MRTILFSYDGEIQMTQVVKGKLYFFLQQLDRKGGKVVAVK